MNNKELGVIVKAKDLCSYVMTVTQKKSKTVPFYYYYKVKQSGDGYYTKFIPCK